MTRKRTANQKGFTVVELIVAVVVIGILAGIVTVGYGAWQKRMATNVLKSDLSQAASQLKNDLNWKNVYPATEAAANDNKGLPKSDGTSYRYTYTSGTNSYCLTASSSRQGVPVFHISSSDTTPIEGACDGHPDGSPWFNTANSTIATWNCTSGCASLFTTNLGVVSSTMQSNAVYEFDLNYGCSSVTNQTCGATTTRIGLSGPFSGVNNFRLSKDGVSWVSEIVFARTSSAGSSGGSSFYVKTPTAAQFASMPPHDPSNPYRVVISTVETSNTQLQIKTNRYIIMEKQ